MVLISIDIQDYLRFFGVPKKFYIGKKKFALGKCRYVITRFIAVIKIISLLDRYLSYAIYNIFHKDPTLGSSNL